MQFLGRRWHWPAGLLTALLALGTWTVAEVRPARPVFSEYQIKAVFLFNFAQFIEWPASAFAEASSPLVIGVLGDDPFGEALEQAVAGEKIANRPLVIRRSQKLHDLQSCHMIFVARSENERLGSILKELRGTGVLSVGETEVFARAGGIIAFLMEGNKVRFAINPEAAAHERLRVSAKLLKLARIVADGVILEDP